jgi:large subunit ribosomal protein L4
MRVDVVNISGSKTGRSVELPDDIFGIEPNEHSVYLAVKQYLAHQRQGTHKSKEKWEINRTTKKLKKQKGTGGARAGSMKSPLFIGGGRVFGPRPRTYDIKLNKQVKVLARKSVLSAKATEGKIVILEDFQLDSVATKSYVSILKGLNLVDSRTLMVTPEHNSNILLSSRNVPNSSVQVAKDLNTYEILNANTLVISERSIEKIIETLAN